MHYIGKLAKGFPIFILALLLNWSTTFAQETEIGFGVGGFQYSGDLSRGITLKSINPGGTAFFRTNLSEPVSFRLGITAGKVAAADERTPIDPAAVVRDASFDIFLFEASTVFEYHFLKWRQPNGVLRWTPYFFGGLAIFGISGEGQKPEEYSNIQPSIPFGLGFKYILNPKLYIGIEFGARKTFFDFLDNVADGDGTVKNFDFGNRFDNDLYYYSGISLTYSFYTIPCPTSPYKKNYRRQ